MSEVNQEGPRRRELLDRIPLREVPPETFGGQEEAREKECDRIVKFVGSWLESSEHVSEEERQRLAAAWRQEMGRDDLKAATLAEIDVTDIDVELLKQKVAELARKYAWQAGDQLIFRMHLQAWNRHSRIVSAGLYYVSNGVRKKVVERCNFRQSRNVLTLSGTPVEGDQPCHVRLVP